MTKPTPIILSVM